MSVDIPSPTPWSELEGEEIAKKIKKAKKQNNTKTAEKLKQIDRRARFLTGDKSPDYDQK